MLSPFPEGFEGLIGKRLCQIGQHGARFRLNEAFHRHPWHELQTIQSHQLFSRVEIRTV